MVHIKDFYLRPAAHDLGPMREVLRIIKKSGYDEYISIEFEGLEDCKLGTRLGLEYVNKEWNAL